MRFSINHILLFALLGDLASLTVARAVTTTDVTVRALENRATVPKPKPKTPKEGESSSGGSAAGASSGTAASWGEVASGNGGTEAVRASGEVTQKTLDDAVSKNLPQNDLGTIESKGYHRDELEYGAANKNDFGQNKAAYIESFFNLKSTGNNWEEFQIANTPGSESPILIYTVNKDENTVFIKKSYNEARDETGRDGATRAMKWRDMVFDSWRAAAGNNVKNLKWIVRDDITTPESKSVIEAAFVKAGADKNKKATFKSTSTGNELAAYQAIAGTPHGQGVIKMLADHHTDLGNLKVVAFHVFTPKSGPNGPGYYAVVAELGHL